MQHRVFIKSYEAVSAAGYGIDEIFENLLDKKCFIVEDGDFLIGGNALLTGKIEELEKAKKFCTAIAAADTPTFATIELAITALQNETTKEALVTASYGLNSEEILRINQEGKYSQSVAKPFDFESTGVNAAEAEALSQIFGQKPLVSSSKGLTGHTFDASRLLSLAVAAKSINEGIIAANSSLEYSFTNIISFAYVNKIKKIKKALVNSKEANQCWSVVLSAI